MDSADDIEIQQTILYHLNMEHAVAEIKEMDCLQFALDFEKQSKCRESAILDMTDM